jgi:hypothetical protein
MIPAVLNATSLVNARADKFDPSGPRFRDESGRGLNAALQRNWLAGLCALLGVFIVGAVYASVGRGPWVDEFWTLWQSQHDIPAADVFRQRWSADFHPPLFSAVHWIATGVLGESMVMHRVLNVMPLGLALAFAVLCARRYPRSFDVMALYAVLLLSFPVTLQFFAETRSYFWQICAMYVLLGSFVVISDGEADLDWPRDRALGVLLIADVVLSFNLHYFASLLSGIALLAFAALCWRRQQWRWATLLLGASAAASVPLIVFVAAQRRFLAEESTHYWATGDAWLALDLISTATNAALVANPVGVVAVGVALLAWIAKAAVGNRTAGVTGAQFVERVAPGRRRMETLVVLLVAAMLFVVCLLVLQARQPIVVTRYLVSLQALVVGLCALLAAPLVMHWRPLAWLLLAVAVVGTALVARRAEREARWDTTAKAAAAAVQACPGAEVRHVLIQKRTSSRNFQTVLHWAYERHGRSFGFRSRAFMVGDRLEPIGGCPAIFWIEHIAPKDIEAAVADPSTALKSFGLDPAAFDVGRAKTIASRSGYVLVAPHRARAPAI